MTVPSCWQFDGSFATLRLGPRRFRFELSRPQDGLVPQVSTNARPSSHESQGVGPAIENTTPVTSLMGVTVLAERTGDVGGSLGARAADEVVDAYIREDDLVVAYQRHGAESLRWQLDWRVRRPNSAEDVPSIHLLISLQTDRLDARPRLQVVTSCLATSAECQDASIVVFRCEDETDSVVLMAIPQDVRSRHLTEARPALLPSQCTGSIWTSEFRFGDEHLEKGVIRRLQLAACWPAARASDPAAVKTLLERFLAAPPPLTT